MRAKIRWIAFASVGLSAMVLALGPHGAKAADQGQYKVGDRVAMPAGYSDKWLDAVIIAVDPANVFPYRVHPLGYIDTMNQSFNARMLKAPGTIKTEPVGGIANDPYLLAAKGQKTFHPAKLYAGAYECYTLGAGQLEAAGILNFTVLDDHRYRDIAGAVGVYRFDAATSSLVFQGGTLNGQHAKYEQASNPPVKTQPPTVTLDISGDSCDLVIR